MKILIYFAKSLGGTERYFSSLKELLILKGHKVKTYYEMPGIEIRSLFFKPSKIEKLIEIANDFDVVISDGFLGGFFPKLKVPLIVVAFHVYSQDYLKKYCNFFKRIYYKISIEPFLRKTFNKANLIIAISKAARESLLEEFRVVKKDQVHTVYPGINLDKFNYKNLYKGEKNKNRINLLFVGNLIKRKGVDLLPRILDLLPENYILRYIGGKRTNRRIKHKRAIRVEAPNDRELIKEYQNYLLKQELILI